MCLFTGKDTKYLYSKNWDMPLVSLTYLHWHMAVICVLHLPGINLRSAYTFKGYFVFGLVSMLFFINEMKTFYQNVSYAR